MKFSPIDSFAAIVCKCLDGRSALRIAVHSWTSGMNQPLSCPARLVILIACACLSKPELARKPWMMCESSIIESSPQLIVIFLSPTSAMFCVSPSNKIEILFGGIMPIASHKRRLWCMPLGKVVLIVCDYFWSTGPNWLNMYVVLPVQGRVIFAYCQVTIECVCSLFCLLIICMMINCNIRIQIRDSYLISAYNYNVFVMQIMRARNGWWYHKLLYAATQPVCGCF